MGHFVINLPNNVFADVRFGIVKEKQFLSLRNIMSGKWWHTEKRKGYVVIIEKRKKCVLFKTMEGEWINENNDDKKYTFWQTKIDEFEATNPLNR